MTFDLKVIITYPGGIIKRDTVNVLVSTTIDAVKTLISSGPEGLSVDVMRLSFGNTFLDDRFPLSFYHIGGKPGDYIMFCLFSNPLPFLQLIVLLTARLFMDLKSL